MRRTVPRSARRNVAPADVTPKDTPQQRPQQQRYAPAFDAAASPAERALPPIRTGVEAIAPPSQEPSVVFAPAPLTAVRWLPVGGRQAVAAVGSGDGGPGMDFMTLYAVRAEKGALESSAVRQLRHPGKVMGIAVSKTANAMFVGSSDGTVRAVDSNRWDDEDADLVDVARLPKRDEGRYEAVMGVAPLSGHYVAALGSEGSLMVADAESCAAIYTLDACDAVGFRAAVAVDADSGSEVISAGASGEVSLWDTRIAGKTRACSQTLRHPATGMLPVSVTVDAAQPHFVLAGTASGELAIWDRRGGDGFPLSRVALHDGFMWDVRVVSSTRPGLLLSCGEDASVWLMDFAAAAGRGAMGSAADSWCDTGEFWRAQLTQSDLRNVGARYSSMLGINSVDAHPRADLFAFVSDSGCASFGSLYG